MAAVVFLALLAVPSRQLWHRIVSESLCLWVVEDRCVRIQTLGHLVADQVDQSFENDVHVDVLLGRCLEKLKS